MTYINYILLAHNQPELLYRIISKLEHPNSFFYVHIDKNSDILPFKEILKDINNVYFLSNHQREEGLWGGFGIVKASISAMRKIVEQNRSGYTVLLSGQDYPIQDNLKIKSFFKNTQCNFIESNPMPLKKWYYGGMDRLTEYRINLSSKRYDYVKIPSIWDSKFYNLKNLEKCYALIIRNMSDKLKLLIKKRKAPYHILPYAGSQWWALPFNTISKILKFIDDKPNFIKYHQHTLLSDEIFFQSIVEHLKLQDNTMEIKNSITYINWTKKNTTLPVTFTTDDKDELAEAAKSFLFARKFNLDTSSTILDWIDSNLH